MNTTLLSVQGPCTVLPEQPKSELQRLVLALEKLDRIEASIYGETYADDPIKHLRTWKQWYMDVAEAVNLVRDKQNETRRSIARQIGAVLYEDRTV